MARVLLSIDRATFMRMHKRAPENDPAVVAPLAKLWEPYAETALECFTCGAADIQPRPVFLMVLPEYIARFAATKLIVAPLCLACRDIQPPQRRFARCLTILKRMAKARDGKGVAFARLPINQPHPT